jgi:hypothetical protein
VVGELVREQRLHAERRDASIAPGGPYNGAMIITFNVDGDPYRAHGEFVTYQGTVLDSYDILASLTEDLSRFLTDRP